ncbi:hypothetical protein P3W53_14280 [Pseudomonas denitrificans (nom. rej.)]|nr:hypothetical protein [Pseudomonas denitrificans (nom. rej.)]
MTTLGNSSQSVSLSQGSNGEQINTYQLPTQHWFIIRALMHQFQSPQSSAFTNRKAHMLPYVYVRESNANTGEWNVISTGITSSGGPCEIKLPITGEGNYRIYIKEPLIELAIGQIFKIPNHALINGEDSDIEVQPWFALKATTIEGTQNIIAKFDLPNPLGRATDGVIYPQQMATATFTHIHSSPSKALDLGEQIITCCLWGDITRTHGHLHPSIQESTHKLILEKIYKEELIASGNSRKLLYEDGEREIEFAHDSTDGGTLKARSFQNQLAMSRDECLRRTHPSVMSFILDCTHDLNFRYIKITGAWRPHTGSTRHRYASALDVTEVRTEPTEEYGNTEVYIRFNRLIFPGPDSNPTGSNTGIDAERRRAASMRFHKYIAEKKSSGLLGWLGGPWQLTYANVGLASNSVFIKTDDIHKNHLHLSIGPDQP